ncbi:MAG: hypothetical protein H6707_19545 [Deltaproteobacteria bacterium]|nr:hypothetical protein [Deltaproteobacteria bacterium]
MWLALLPAVAMSFFGIRYAAERWVWRARKAALTPPIGRRPRALLICGSVNQTTQMEAVADQLDDFDCYFAPYYSDRFLMRAGYLLGFQERTIGGSRLQGRCLAHLRRNNRPIDLDGSRFDYDLVVTCSDLVLPMNACDKPLVAVQEGAVDPHWWLTPICRGLPFLPRWWGGTAMTGQSGLFDKFCVASEGFRDHFVKEGVDPQRIAVTGIPNFDDCARYQENDFPHHDYVLVCTSDGRETLKADDREALLRQAVEIAAGRQLIFKLHPNEKHDRATREIALIAPDALVYTAGSAEEMVANCAVLIAEWSTLSFVALALGKEVHCNFDLQTLRKLTPLQNRRAAREIAGVCRDVCREHWGFEPKEAPIQTERNAPSSAELQPRRRRA